jgi:hypothetical protein
MDVVDPERLSIFFCVRNEEEKEEKKEEEKEGEEEEGGGEKWDQMRFQVKERDNQCSNIKTLRGKTETRWRPSTTLSGFGVFNVGLYLLDLFVFSFFFFSKSHYCGFRQIIVFLFPVMISPISFIY